MKGLRLCILAVVLAGLVAAGCGDDDDADEAAEEQATELAVPGADEAATLQEDIAGQTDEDQIEAVGEAWAELYGAEDETMCAYLHPDLGGASSCALYVQGALTGSSKVQASFAGATVEGVNLDGDTATAEFSNGEQVEFARDPDGAWKVIETPRAG
jgi:outer membrane murein-binding lipoprotein Lpp